MKSKRYPASKDVDIYNKAHRAIRKTLDAGIISPKQYEELFLKWKLDEVMPKVVGWALERCKHCLSVIEPKSFNLDVLSIERCDKMKPNEKCYIIGKRCRDVKNDVNTSCRNLNKKLKLSDDLENIRWHFLSEYAFNHLTVKSSYCSSACKKMAQNRRNYNRNWLKRKMKRL